jgi:hypothetical protein
MSKMPTKEVRDEIIVTSEPASDGFQADWTTCSGGDPHTLIYFAGASAVSSIA